MSKIIREGESIVYDGTNATDICSFCSTWSNRFTGEYEAMHEPGLIRIKTANDTMDDGLYLYPNDTVEARTSGKLHYIYVKELHKEPNYDIPNWGDKEVTCNG